MVAAFSEQRWISILLVLFAVIVAAAALSLAVARPRRQVFAPFLLSALVSVGIYLIPIAGHAIRGRDDFHVRLGVALLAAAAIALALGSRRSRNGLATAAFAALGAIAPVLAFFAFVAAACSSGGCD